MNKVVTSKTKKYMSCKWYVCMDSFTSVQTCSIQVLNLHKTRHHPTDKDRAVCMWMFVMRAIKTFRFDQT